jgi:signal transduction histidine kinase/CheY-like chemotaxis protein/HPt (histidine-containing phosphotransfer) domain-containing protein
LYRKPTRQIFPKLFQKPPLQIIKIMRELNADDEKLRLAALKELQILDTLPEQEFDDITLLASQICETPIATISLIDESRQWFKSHVGLPDRETPREYAFCDHAIKQEEEEEEELFIVADAALDTRFSANPLVTGAPHIRFYAGAPLVTSDGHKLGTLCVIDKKPRGLSESQQRALNALARSVMNLIEARSLKNASVAPETGKRTNIFSAPEENSARNTSFFKRYLKHYLSATTIVAAITLIKIFLDSVAQVESPFLLFAFAILLAAWRGGFGPGLYATFASVLIVNYYFLPPGGGLFYHDFRQNLLFLVFILQGVFIAALCASRLRNERLLQRAGKELENRVAKRTTQLAQANGELRQEIEERNLLQENLRHARDAAVESARLKSEFLANMSHEIRTPMNGVIGMTGLLLETPLDDEQKRFAKIIRTSGESLLTIINDILDFSKVEAGKLELETLDFDLREIIESLIEMFSPRAREQNDELEALIQSDIPLALRGDAGRIRQILTNLIGNAIKFTKNGDIRLRVEKLRETAQQVELKFSVTDTGEGISEAAQSCLFQPFTQSDASTTRRFGGTGLGLSISKKLVEMMRGEIGLESRLGEGSIFWFTITLEKQSEQANSVRHQFETAGKLVPIGSGINAVGGAQTAEDADIHITAIPETQNISAGKFKRILIVEDNSVNQLVAQNMLKNFGYHTDVAANGREALRALEVLPYDLILMDCQMPEMDGYEATREIRARDWLAARAPIIALTAHATAGEREKCLRAGMDDYVSKPVEKENLRRTVAHWLAKSEDAEFISAIVEAGKNSVEVKAEADAPAVDFATLDDITDNDPELKREVVATYLRQTVVNLAEIERAITTNDAQKLYEVAHKTVGGSALCGMTAIVAPLRRLEQLGRDGKVEQALEFYITAQNAFAAIDRECHENILDL